MTHPSEDDHEVIAKRYTVEAEALPESTKEEITAKISKLESEAKDAKDVADADMLDDRTDSSVIQVYRDERMQQIQTVREATLDKILRAKAAKIGKIVERLKGAKEKLGEIKEEIKAKQQDAAASFRNLTFGSASRSALEYLNNAVPYKRNRTRRKKRGHIDVAGS